MLTMARILLFAKTPVAGEVKTRLIPRLGAEGAADLYKQLLRRTLATLCHDELAPVELWCTPSMHHPLFKQHQHEFCLTLHEQQGADLGARMLYAAQTVLQRAE